MMRVLGTARSRVQQIDTRSAVDRAAAASWSMHGHR